VIDLLHSDHFLHFTAIELQVNPTQLSVDTEFRNIITWSSLNALLFISRINEETNVLISAADLAGCKTIGDIHHLIIQRSNGASRN
jgi:acyl carrier protein